MNYEELRQIILEIEELKLKAQLRAVREAMKSNNRAESPQKPTRISQTEYVYQLLKEERSPLHIKDIIKKCRSKYDIVLQRETIVSALLKKIDKLDRFIRTAPNTFGLREYLTLYQEQQKSK